MNQRYSFIQFKKKYIVLIKDFQKYIVIGNSMRNSKLTAFQ